MTSTSVPSTYKAYVYERFGTIEEVLTLKDVAAAPLPSTHVRVRVHSVALNPIDYKLPEFFREAFTRSTPSAEKPHPIGFDVAGEVVEIGHDVSGFQLGDKVFAMAGKAGDGLFGTFAEYASVDAKLLALAPSSVALEHAAGVPLVALTGYDALALKAKVQSGERVLVLGGTTSCGIFGIQYAKAIGATVIATTSTKNVAFVQALGADQVIDYTQEKWGDVLARHSIDVIFDCEIEPESWDGAAQLVLKQNTGRFVTLRPGLTPSAAKFGATYYDVHTEPTGHNLTLISQLIDGGKLKPVVDSVFSFDKMADAFTRLKTGRPVGKVVVKLL